MGALLEQDDIELPSKMAADCAHSAKGFFRLPEEPDFQKAFAEHEGAPYASVVNAAGTGLDLAMWALDVGPDDEVITTPLTFVCSATCAMLRGAKIVFADIDPMTYNLDPAAVEKKITKRTKVIIPVHFGGIPCDFEGFDRLAQKYGVKIVYDAAHATGSKYRGKPIGAYGDMTVYSFQTNKNMTTLGEGGAVTTANETYYRKLERIKSFGFQYGAKDDVVELGSNYRMTKVQSASGILQLQKVDRNNAKRARDAQFLCKMLAGTPEIIRPQIPSDCFSASHLNTFRVDDENYRIDPAAFFEMLKKEYTVGISFHYKPVYSWKVFQDAGYGAGETPIADKVCRQLFQLPVFYHMTDDDYRYVAWAVKECVSALKK
jgi:dTDP-4-amino-4,6-dideoxygalactose transaminase